MNYDSKNIIESVENSSLIDKEIFLGCITKDAVFKSKFATIYIDIDLNEKFLLGRKFIPRKKLTEFYNSGIETNEWMVEENVCFDYLVKKNTKKYRKRSNTVLSYDKEVFDVVINEPPFINEEFKLKNFNKDKFDRLSADDIKVTVKEVYPFRYVYDLRLGGLTKLPSRTHGTVVLTIERNSELKRSLVLPSLVPKHALADLSAV